MTPAATTPVTAQAHALSTDQGRFARAATLPGAAAARVMALAHGLASLSFLAKLILSVFPQVR